MPIWKTSELQAGRPGSPRRSSRSTSYGMPNSGGASALPPLGLPSDNYDLIQSATVGLAGVGLRHRNGVDADDSLPSPTAAAHAELISAALALAPPSMQPSKSVKHPQAGGASTYTLQYIGVSNGELGILSQKQVCTKHMPRGGGAPAEWVGTQWHGTLPQCVPVCSCMHCQAHL